MWSNGQMGWGVLMTESCIVVTLIEMKTGREAMDGPSNGPELTSSRSYSCMKLQNPGSPNWNMVLLMVTFCWLVCELLSIRGCTSQLYSKLGFLMLNEACTIGPEPQAVSTSGEISAGVQKIVCLFVWQEFQKLHTYFPVSQSCPLSPPPSPIWSSLNRKGVLTGFK